MDEDGGVLCRLCTDACRYVFRRLSGYSGGGSGVVVVIEDAVSLHEQKDHALDCVRSIDMMSKARARWRRNMKGTSRSGRSMQRDEVGIP